jgi:formylmethanofuran dehydrogenase subunit E
MNMHEFAQSRTLMETMIRGDDLEGLLRQVEHMHGHLCPGVSLGVKAGHYAMKAVDRENTGMEELAPSSSVTTVFPTASRW